MNDSRRTTLVFAPHLDDEILGVGGTIIKRADAGERVVICVATENEDFETRYMEAMEVAEFVGIEDIVFLKLPDLGLDMVPHRKFTGMIQDVIQMYEPDEVFTPHPGDLHTDHKALTAAVLVALRPKYRHVPDFAYTYETLSETGWDYQSPQNCFSPNVYVDITDSIDRKIAALMLYRSQVEEYPQCRSEDALIGLSMYRGTQAGMRNAEAFSIVRGYVR